MPKVLILSMKPSTPKNSHLTIVILNYNSGHYLADCLASLTQSQLRPSQSVDIVIVDNASTDTSVAQARKIKPVFDTKYLLLNSNLGFAGGNNYGLKKIKTNPDFVLFLNPDMLVNTETLAKTIDFLTTHPKASAVTCRLILAKTGQTQPECHRGFPTPWRAFCHFSGLAKIFPHSELFNGYFLGHLDLATTHPVEACVGAFLCVRFAVGQKIGWWNEKYFFYGEDLDFCYQLYQHGYQLFYYPGAEATHYQGISSGLKSHTQAVSTASISTKVRSAKASTQAMRTFYHQNYFKHYHPFVRLIVNAGINLLENIRVFKAKHL